MFFLVKKIDLAHFRCIGTFNGVEDESEVNFWIFEKLRGGGRELSDEMAKYWGKTLHGPLASEVFHASN